MMMEEFMNSFHDASFIDKFLPDNTDYKSWNMKLFLNLLFIVFITHIFLIFYGLIKGVLSFGYGLGDIYYLVLLLILFLIIVWIRIKAKGRNVLFITLIMFAILILIALKLTIWRGPEFKWNGNIFI
jgi:hypothetical protein